MDRVADRLIASLSAITSETVEVTPAVSAVCKRATRLSSGDGRQRISIVG